eukprot:647145-Pleurochrysis_carterae.AAC.3
MHRTDRVAKRASSYLRLGVAIFSYDMLYSCNHYKLHTDDKHSIEGPAREASSYSRISIVVHSISMSWEHKPTSTARRSRFARRWYD